MFIIVNGLKPHHRPGLNYVREVIKDVFRLCARERNQHVEKLGRRNNIKREFIKPA